MTTAAEEHLATRIAAALQPCLRLAEIDRARRKPDADLSPHDLTLRAMPGVLSLEAEGNARALDSAGRARPIATRPRTGHGARRLGARAARRLSFHRDSARRACPGADLARKAQALAADATALAVLGNALTLLHEVETADLVIRRALAVDGGSAWAWSRSGWIDVYKGDADSAIERFKIALDLAPHDTLAFNSMVGIGCAHFHAGRYREAAQMAGARAGRASVGGLDPPHHVPAYVLGGAPAEGQRSLAALLGHYPDLTVSEVDLGLPPLQQSYRDRIVEALHTAGLAP